jgi:MFS family permease
MPDETIDARLNERHIAARIERLPFTSWQLIVGIIIARAWFFDAVDALAIAYVLPVLNGLWKLAPSQTGMLIAAGYAGQTIGSIVAGSLAERWGRVPVLLVTLLLFSIMSLACAFAWSFDSMLWFRLIQGIGLGGEVPIMITYINEFSRARGRGTFALGIQVLFAFGLTASAFLGSWIVPRFGGNGCSLSARHRRCLPCRCAGWCLNRPAGSPARDASPRRMPFSAKSSRSRRGAGSRCLRCRPICRRRGPRRAASAISSRVSI